MRRYADTTNSLGAHGDLVASVLECQQLGSPLDLTGPHWTSLDLHWTSLDLSLGLRARRRYPLLPFDGGGSHDVCDGASSPVGCALGRVVDGIGKLIGPPNLFLLRLKRGPSPSVVDTEGGMPADAASSRAPKCERWLPLKAIEDTEGLTSTPSLMLLVWESASVRQELNLHSAREHPTGARECMCMCTGSRGTLVCKRARARERESERGRAQDSAHAPA